MRDKVSILQTGRLGDLWYTAPLANWLHENGHEVEVVYDDAFGNPFSFFPYIKSRPVRLRRYCKKNEKWGHFFNEAVWQIKWFRKLKSEGRCVVWNEIYPFRWPLAHLKGGPYVDYWYRNYPTINYRTAPSTLSVTEGKTVLVFQESQSISFKVGKSYTEWIMGNLETLIQKTGLEPIVVAYGDQPDHPEYKTWRGSLEEYQQLIASCGMVYGISTSAHVLGQLLGKPVIALYNDRQSSVDTIGAENARLNFPERLTNEQLEKLEW